MSLDALDFLKISGIELSDEERLVLKTIVNLMDKYPELYWNKIDEESRYPDEFVSEFFDLGFGGLLIPSEYGGGGFGVKMGALLLKEINRLGGNAYFVHGHFYITGMLAKCASKYIAEKYFPAIAKGSRIMSMAVTEPEVGSDTTKIRTFAERTGNKYVIRGHKIFISRVKHSDLILVLARTKSYEDVERKTEGLTLFLVDLHEAKGIDMEEIKTMANTDAYELFIDGIEVPEENVIGEVHNSWQCLLKALNIERAILSAESIGDAEWFLTKAIDYANRRVVFGRPIGSNQGVQYPIADIYIKLLATYSMLKRTLEVIDDYHYDEKLRGIYATSLKYIAADLSWEAANVAMDIHGGYGYAKEIGIERKLRETRLYKIAPISSNLVLSFIAQDALKLPRAF
jgi:alkylation response protein AidB-like acyl-CoA dehydrogenase